MSVIRSHCIEGNGIIPILFCHAWLHADARSSVSTSIAWRILYVYVCGVCVCVCVCVCVSSTGVTDSVDLAESLTVAANGKIPPLNDRLVEQDHRPFHVDTLRIFGQLLQLRVFIIHAQRDRILWSSISGAAILARAINLKVHALEAKPPCMHPQSSSSCAQKICRILCQ